MTDSPDVFRIAVMISGGGTTLRNLIEKSNAGKLNAEIALVISSSKTAGGIEFAKKEGIPFDIIRAQDFDSIEKFSEQVFDSCRIENVDLVVMGGFLKRVLIPDDFENRVINIHPSLIPKYCGQGFYGIRVHRAVIEAGESESGCTVHIVDDEYDHGPMIEQATVPVQPNDTPESLAARVFEAECELYPGVINRIAAASLNEDES